MAEKSVSQIVFSGDPLLEELVEAFAGMRGVPVASETAVGSRVLRFRITVTDASRACRIADELKTHLKEYAPLVDAHAPLRYRIIPVRRDWARNHRRYLHGRAVAGSFFIHPPWETPHVPAGLIPLSIDPGASFGTGHHPTTALCLAWLAESSVTERRVLDAGCGSGVLAIAAVALGAAVAIGFDIDADAVDAARENAARNGVSERCRFFSGPLAELAETDFDLILANLLPSEFLPMAASLAAVLAPGGRVLFSGIDAEQLPAVCAELERAVSLIGEPVSAEGWAAVVAGQAHG